MGLFSRGSRERPSGGPRLPAGFAQTLSQYGRFQFDPQGSGIEPSRLGGGNFEYELYQLAQPDPAAFTSAVSDVATAAGGWALWGGAYAVWNAVGGSAPIAQDDHREMVAAAVDFVLEQGYTMMHVPPFMAEAWREQRDANGGPR